MVDDDGDGVIVETCDVGSATFIACNVGGMVITVGTTEDPGEYKIRVVIKDDNSGGAKSKEYKLVVTINEP